MSPAFHGADPEQLRQFACDLDHAHDVLASVQSQLSQRITHQLRWQGPDAFVFRHAWQSSYSPVIARTAAMLSDTAARIRAEAAEQEASSS